MEETDGMPRRYDRREFLEKASAWAVAASLAFAAGSSGCDGKEEGCPLPVGGEAGVEELPAPGGERTRAGLVVVKGEDPAEALRAAWEEWYPESLDLSGKRVLLKVNAAFARQPSDAVTTDPALLAEAVRLFKAAGAAEVVVYDHILQDLVDPTLEKNGLGQAAREQGAKLAVYPVRKPGSYKRVRIPGARALPEVGILDEIFHADLVVNMPKAKHHSGARLSLSLKNLIGCTADMGKMHSIELHRAIAELGTVVKPYLVIMDATSVLLDGGPGGPGTVATPGKVIVGSDPVAVDAYTCGIFGVEPMSVGYIYHAHELGVGSADLSRIKVRELKV